MQLIQYAPSTAEVKRRPLLIIPPWINKFYILDLQPKNSFIKWAVDQGHTVFVISWVNPDERLAHKSFENYLLEGPIAALDVVEAATGVREVNAIGYCLGGTLLAATLAYLTAKNDDRIGSATYFVALVDFTDTGDLAVFIDKQQLAVIERRMRKRGYLEGREMATAFNMLRANDLIWSFVVDNYLLGKKPVPFDLLYWNSDSTRMPVEMHSFYLRTMYHENRLAKPGGICLAGVPIDLTRIRTPTFIVSAREDHIAPWRSTYMATRLYRGPIKFVLAESGPHCRDHQSARQPVRSLAEPGASRASGTMVRGRRPRRVLLVAGVGRMGRGIFRRFDPRPRTRGTRLAADRGRARLVCSRPRSRHPSAASQTRRSGILRSTPPMMLMASPKSA